MSFRLSRASFAAAIVGLGIIGVIYGSSELPKTLPGRAAIHALIAAIEIASGIGLLLGVAKRYASLLLLVLLILWAALLRLPPLLHDPMTEGYWQSLGELLAMASGAWCLFAAYAGPWEKAHLKFAVGENGVRIGRIFMIAALPMFGFSHFAYAKYTATFIPEYLHVPYFWVYFTGTASIVAAVAMIAGIVPRLAANLEALMLWLITLLVWVPRLVAKTPDEGTWSEVATSCAIAAGAWIVAETYRSAPWLGIGAKSRAITVG